LINKFEFISPIARGFELLSLLVIRINCS